METLADQAVRERLRENFETTFFVEAGAGTGKTRELVARIVGMVAAGVLTMDGLVAITFTEAAAAELRDRVRQGLAERAADSSVSNEESHRCAAAAAQMDLSSLQTIHAFAATLLRKFPLEAGLPPGFDIWDDIQQEQHFLDRFRAWLYDEVPVADGSGRREAVRRVLALGMTSDRLSDLAAALRERRDCLDTSMRWSSGSQPDIVTIARENGNTLTDLQGLIKLARNGSADSLVQEVLSVQFTAGKMAGAVDVDQAIAALLALLGRKPRQVGAQINWGTVANGDNAARYIKETFKTAVSDADEAITSFRTYAFAELLPHLVAFTLAAAEERREHGVATFHDLLVWARDLLRDHPSVRAEAHHHCQRIFVDEFQDTDPLQAELVYLLASDPGQAAERDWRRLRLAPGKLFLVGDPKQSIYRFRRADIAVYSQVYGRADDGCEVASLVQTFRSVDPIVRWVNAHFGPEMVEQSGVQARYAPLVARPPLEGAAVLDHECGVRVVGGPIAGKAAHRWQLEAEAVATLAHQIVAEAWPVSARTEASWMRRPPRYSDICILLPTRTNLRRLERALERADVPYRMESGSLVLSTQEVRDLLSCLRAIDDPSDQVALIGALRSTAYGCSDVDLLRWVEAGGRLDYEFPGRQDESCVSAAFESLRNFHEQRMTRSPAVTIEIFIRERGLAIQTFGQPRPRDAWRRLRYVVNQAHRLSASGYVSLRSVLDWLEARQRDVHYDAVATVPDADEDAVRLMTVHGAKGLEFPVVVLTGLGSVETLRNTVSVAVDYQSGAVEVRCGEFQTPGYDPQREQQLFEAEQLRLLYVAATRAREHLVLSLYHERPQSHAGRIWERLHQTKPPLHLAIELVRRSQQVAPAWVPREPPAAEAHVAAEEAWEGERHQQIEDLADVPVFTPSGLNAELLRQPADEAESGLPGIEEREAVRPRVAKGGSNLGLAVHAVLQWLDLETLQNLDDLANWAASAHGVRASDVRRFAERAATSDAVRRIAATGRYWREVPICADIDGSLIEGIIDLLYEREDGTLGVLDYKTDELRSGTTDEHADHYRIQGGAYVLAVQVATGREVTSVEFLFPSTDPSRMVRYDANRANVLATEVRGLLPAGRLQARTRPFS